MSVHASGSSTKQAQHTSPPETTTNAAAETIGSDALPARGAARVLQMQRTIGNQAVMRRLVQRAGTESGAENKSDNRRKFEMNLAFFKNLEAMGKAAPPSAPKKAPAPTPEAAPANAATETAPAAQTVAAPDAAPASPTTTNAPKMSEGMTSARKLALAQFRRLSPQTRNMEEDQLIESLESESSAINSSPYGSGLLKIIRGEVFEADDALFPEFPYLRYLHEIQIGEASVQADDERSFSDVFADFLTSDASAPAEEGKIKFNPIAMKDSYKPGGSDDDQTMKVDYLDEETLASYELKTSKDVFVWQGKPVDTSDWTRTEIPKEYTLDKGYGIYVMTTEGKIYLAFDDQHVKQFKSMLSSFESEPNPKLKHSSFLAGKEVATAGDISFEKGKLVRISNMSGHYHPGAESMLKLLQLFQKCGINLHGVKVWLAGVFDGEMADKMEGVDAHDLVSNFQGSVEAAAYKTLKSMRENLVSTYGADSVQVKNLDWAYKFESLEEKVNAQSAPTPIGEAHE